MSTPIANTAAQILNQEVLTNPADLTSQVTGELPTANIANNAVSNAKLAQMAAHTFKGNNTGSTANAADLTAAQATAELNAMVGDSGSGGTKGLVPAPAAGDAAAGKFLKADGTFAVPSGSGSGTVTNTGTLTANALILGNGGVDVAPMASLGTTTTVLHGNAAGAPTFGAVSLTADVSGDLPFANLAQIAGLSVLGVTGSSTADVAAITAGTDNHVLTRVSSSSLAFAMPAMVKIEEQTPTGASVTFNSLGSFTHLKILFSARGDQAATTTAVNATFNADSGSNYDRQQFSASATGSNASESLGQTSVSQIVFVSAASATTGMVGRGEITFLDYRGTTFWKGGTSVLSRMTATSSGGLDVETRAWNWRSTSAITSITLTLASGNFVSGSKFTLYGLS